MPLFKVCGNLAHQRPKNNIDCSRIIRARDAIHALNIYCRKLKGVKKKQFLSVTPVGPERK